MFLFILYPVLPIFILGTYDIIIKDDGMYIIKDYLVTFLKWVRNYF